MTFLNIVTADRGWILETLARETAARLPYVAFGDGPRADAAMHYYITHAARRRRRSPLELAFFTHLEPDPSTARKFFETALDVEHCVCQSALYATMLRDAGVTAVTIIPPGVDLATFRPLLRIGVIGRTYHTGRKGEHLVEALRDIPEIEWVFTNAGWPERGLDPPAEALPALYRSLDYVLVPSLYEGGPMCVIEALACGTEVIAPPVGWVPDFPHLEFPAGDTAALRTLLTDLIARKRARRETVLGLSWDAWAEAHDRLFQSLAREHGIALRRPPARPRHQPRAVGLLLHGNEGDSQGGPSVRVPRLAQELAEHGQPAELRRHPARQGFEGLDLVHVFNSWPPWSAPDAVRRARAAGAAVVFSPILLEHRFSDLWGDRLPRLFAEAEPGAATQAALDAFRAAVAARRAADAPPTEPAPGFHAALREMAAASDRLILLSERERARLARIGAETGHGRVVRNPVDAPHFAAADPALFRRETGLHDFVLCVARLEPRKNQLMLIHALRETGLPLVLLGHGTDAAFRETLERHRPPAVRVLDRLPPDSPLLASAFAAARVFALPSWAEGAPLAALEAAAAGAPLVLTDESGEREYFGDAARYADPADAGSIRDAVLAAWDSPRTPADVAAQFSWDRHRAATEAVYAEAMAARPRAAPPPPAPALPKRRRLPVVFDVTTSANHKGRWTGIARVEAELAAALRAHRQAETRFIAWNNDARAFVEIPFAALRDGTLAEALAARETEPVDLPEGAPLFAGGSAWMQNALYVERLIAFARARRLKLTALLHDVIPVRFPFWFGEGYAPVFEHNLTLLLDGAEALLAVSDCTRREVEAFAARVPGLMIPPIGLLREGDAIGDTGSADAVAARFAQQPFVLSVGAIHTRKNHRLLYDVWLGLVRRMGARCPHLVLVGGVAWNGTDLARALREDARLEGRVTILDDVDDAALGWLYRHCLFTAYPSLHEGWGLPVAESLRHGKHCLAANVASIPEIAPGLVELLDPLDVAAWSTRIEFLAGSAAARAAAEARIAAGYVPRSWAAAGDDLLKHLAAVPKATRVPRPYVPGVVIPFGDRITASRLRWGGWHPFEKWGCWASDTTASLRFEPTTRDTPLLLLAEVRALPRDGGTFGVAVRANGETVARWRIPGGGFHLFQAMIPWQPTIRVDFVCDALTPVAAVSNPDDARHVGLGLTQLALAPLAAVADAGRYFEMHRPGQARLAPGHRQALLRAPETRGILEGAWRAMPAWGMCSAEPCKRIALTVLDRPGDALAVELRLRPVATAAQPLSLTAAIAGESLGSFAFDSADPATVTLRVPPALRARAQPMTIELAATGHAPQALGLGAAAEPFGFGLLAVAANLPGFPHDPPRIPLEPGGEAALAAGEASSAVAAALGDDWHAPERTATWSSGREARLPLRLLPPAGAALALEIETYRPAAGAETVRLAVSAAGHRLGEWFLKPRRRETLEFAVPPACIGEDGALDLDIAVDAATSPFVAGDGKDERCLGFRVSAVRRVADHT
jgi:glycosyltransferase involved in cell wall biosynthesis